jgi:hypothetical protein
METFEKLAGCPEKEASVKLGPREVWLLKILRPLKRSQLLCIRTMGKRLCGHLRNWPGPTHHRLGLFHVTKKTFLKKI